MVTYEVRYDRPGKNTDIPNLTVLLGIFFYCYAHELTYLNDTYVVSRDISVHLDFKI